MYLFFSLLQISEDGSIGFGTALYAMFMIAISILSLIAMWMTYEKAGKPGWATIIPLYNVWVLFEMAGKPGWWLLLLYIPVVNIFVYAVAMIELGKRFKDPVWSVVFLVFLSMIGFIILGFGSDVYRKPKPTHAYSNFI